VDPSHYERYEHGSPAAELPVFAALAREIMRAQERNRRRAGIRDVRRAFHPRALLGATEALTSAQRLVPTDDDSPLTIGATMCPALRAMSGLTVVG